MTSPVPPGPVRDGRAVLVYTAARFALFLLCLVLGWVAGLGGLVLIVVALVVSGALSWFLLSRQRIAMGAAAEQVLTRTRSRLGQRTAAEDAYADRMRGTIPDDRAL